MALFYYDENMNQLEKNNEYLELINYIENRNNIENSVKIATGLAYSWYLFEEGELICRELRNDWEKFFEKFKYYEDICLSKYSNEPKILLILGYILDINWMLIYQDEKYEKLGKDLLKKAFSISTDEDVANLAKYFCSTDLSQKNQLISLINLDKLFPSNSILDKYFREIIR